MQTEVAARRHVLFFTKYPTPGFAKTRMIDLLGEDGAAALSRDMSEHMLAVLRRFCSVSEAAGEGVPTLLRVLYAGSKTVTGQGEESDEKEAAERMRVRAWIGDAQSDARERVERQCEGDLGQRLTEAFRASFEDMGATEVLVLGSDIPAIDLQTLQAAFDALRSVDVVVGPSVDGGYYLLAVKKNQHAQNVFDRIPWSTPQTLEVTKQRMTAAALSYRELHPLVDVDEPADFAVWERISGKSTANYRTR